MKLPSLTIDSRLRYRNLPRKLRKALMRSNTFVNPEYQTASKHSPYAAATMSEHLAFYGTDDDTGELSLYRGASLSLLEDSARERLLRLRNVTDNRVSAPITWPTPRIKPSVEQAGMLRRLDDALAANARPFGNLLLTASTAVGKTVLMLLLARKLGQRTLVLCHTELILRAWISDALMTYGFNKRTLGIIRRDKFFIGKHLTLASPKTLIQREDRWPEINAQFGCIICDEAQNLSAPYIFDFFSQSPARYVVGTTATDTRKGAVVQRLRMCVGAPLVSFDSGGLATSNSLPISKVNMVSTAFEYEGVSDAIDWHALSWQLSLDEERNALIVRHVVADWSNGRVVLLVTKSIEHVHMLHEMLTEAGVTNVNLLTGQTNSSRFYTDKLIGAVRDRKVTCIVGTIQAIKEGANIPVLDTLHLAMPTATGETLEQLLGRIRRKAADKQDATLTYYFDGRCSYLASLYNRVAVPIFRKLKIRGYATV